MTLILNRDTFKQFGDYDTQISKFKSLISKSADQKGLTPAESFKDDAELKADLEKFSGDLNKFVDTLKGLFNDKHGDGEGAEAKLKDLELKTEDTPTDKLANIDKLMSHVNVRRPFYMSPVTNFQFIKLMALAATITGTVFTYGTFPIVSLGLSGLSAFVAQKIALTHLNGSSEVMEEYKKDKEWSKKGFFGKAISYAAAYTYAGAGRGWTNSTLVNSGDKEEFFKQTVYSDKEKDATDTKTLGVDAIWLTLGGLVAAYGFGGAGLASLASVIGLTLVGSPIVKQIVPNFFKEEATTAEADKGASKKDDNGENPSNDNANAVEPAKATELNAGNVDAAAEATVKSDATTDAPTNTIVSDETPVLGVEGSEIKSDENVENNTHTV
tara:strand:+ start:11362 stop:12513 length:1152 start_codon:yes stop_codon:yes gene_type:complete